MNKIESEEAFLADNAADFAGDHNIARFTMLINAEKVRILEFNARKTSSVDDKRRAGAVYEDYRRQLSDLLKLFVGAAAIVDADIPHTADKYKNPYPRSDHNLIAKATSFAIDSVPIQHQLIEAGLPPEAIDNLLLIRDAFQTASLAYESTKTGRAEAVGGMVDAFRKIMEYSKRRGRSVRLKYRNNPAKLAAWAVASHLERAPHREKSAPKAKQEVTPATTE
ncbi:MAG: hypothetical protein JSS81_15875 [Acidobacteria bacterium]|nr:hypothetical protein [Acidobacteriota bacterium]